MAPRMRLARVSFTVEECSALRQAAERVPEAERSQALRSALRVLGAVLRAVEQARRQLDPEDDTPTPVPSRSP